MVFLGTVLFPYCKLGVTNSVENIVFLGTVVYLYCNIASYEYYSTSLGNLESTGTKPMVQRFGVAKKQSK